MGKTSPEAMGLLPDGDTAASDAPRPAAAVSQQKNVSLKPVMKDFRFWLLAVCNSLAVITVMMTFVHQISYAVNINIGKVEAAGALGVVGLTSSCGKFFFGWLCDRIRDAKYAASLGFFIMSVGMFCLLKAETVWLLYLYALIYGFGYGSLAPVMPYIISDRFGRHILGSAFGALVFFVAGIGGSIGPTLGGLIFDQTGSYANAWTFNTAVLLLVSLLILLLKPAPKRL